MAVKIRLKKMGRRHRPYFRVCVMDARSPRNGRVLEEVGTYDPMVPETDARALLDGERINYWLGVGAQPTEKTAVLIKKYGKDGTHLELQKTALEKLAASRQRRSLPTELPKAAKAPEKRKRKFVKVVQEALPEAATETAASE
ncbi:MAG: 30S ribosomal protein S16 [Planctomycetaceae bacterium]|jgi:small subunit ribosomal protein S16|nr:30S ribosomal protein S16 [Planctomycetaceae bacterium]